MKKVWIASIFATLMLLVPMTSVVGASDTVEDCNCNPINDLQLVRIERLLDRLESRINFILLRYGHIPEIAEKCVEVLEIINLDGSPEAFCDALAETVDIILYIQDFIPDVLWSIFFLIPFFILTYLYWFYCKEGHNYPIPELTDQ